MNVVYNTPAGHFVEFPNGYALIRYEDCFCGCGASYWTILWSDGKIASLL